MSDSDKRFDATPSRRAKARREGNLPRASEFGTNAAFAVAVLATIATVPALAMAAHRAIEVAAAGGYALPQAVTILVLALIPMVAGALGGACAGIIQTQGVVFVVPTFKFERLAPVEGLKRMVSRDALTHVIRAMIAFCAASALCLGAFRDVLASAFANRTPLVVADVAWQGALHVAGTAAVIGILVGMFEFGAARRSWLKKLRMSLHELKRDIKEHDGDPHAKGRRKSLHRSLVRGSLKAVKDAAFVVVNPTHVAVALQYNPPEVPVPVVLVRAADEMALRVRELATEANIPIIENIPLARALFHGTDAGMPIPPEHYVAVAEIVASLARSKVL